MCPGVSCTLLLPHCCHSCRGEAYQMLPVAKPVRKLVGEKLYEAYRREIRLLTRHTATVWLKTLGSQRGKNCPNKSG